jgi:hypothetical protein
MPEKGIKITSDFFAMPGWQLNIKAEFSQKVYLLAPSFCSCAPQYSKRRPVTLRSFDEKIDNALRYSDSMRISKISPCDICGEKRLTRANSNPPLFLNVCAMQELV